MLYNLFVSIRSSVDYRDLERRKSRGLNTALDRSWKSFVTAEVSSGAVVAWRGLTIIRINRGNPHGLVNLWLGIPTKKAVLQYDVLENVWLDARGYMAEGYS